MGKLPRISVAGTWTQAGEHRPSDRASALTCTSGVNGKCVRLGYRPWKTRDGASLWELHQARARMLRADYCGDGTPHTRDGTPVEVYDTLGIQTRDPASGLSSKRYGDQEAQSASAGRGSRSLFRSTPSSPPAPPGFRAMSARIAPSPISGTPRRR